MSQHILITGAAGYIGGSIVTDILSKHSDEISRSQVFAAVRSDEQAKALSNLGIKILKLDLANEQAVIDSISSHQISVVVHTASSIDPSLALPMINALAKEQEITGKPTHFIHTSALGAFYPKSGWPSTISKDTGAVFETEKELADSHPIRKTDVTIMEHAQVSGVNVFIVVPSIVYGRGTGQWNQLSVVIPGLVQAALKRERVYKFDKNFSLQAVHITDLTSLYWQIISAVLHNEKIPSGGKGYYFGVAHDMDMWEFMDHLAAAMKTRGLVSDENPDIFPSDDFAAEAIGIPVQFLDTIFKSGGHFEATKPESIGWKPEWDRDRFLKNVHDQIEDVVELGKAKSSLIDSLFAAVGEASKGQGLNSLIEDAVGE